MNKVKYYIMKGGIIINNYPTYKDAKDHSEAYPGCKILKDTYDENQYGAPSYPWPTDREENES